MTDFSKFSRRAREADALEDKAATAEAALKARLKVDADAIVAECEAAGHPELAAGAWEAKLSLAQVKEALAIRKANEDRAATAEALSETWARWNAAGKPPATVTEINARAPNASAEKSLDGIRDAAFKKFNAARGSGDAD